MKFNPNKTSIIVILLCLVILFVCFYLYDTFSVPTQTTQGWQISTPEEQGMRSELLVEMMETIRNNSYDIDSVIIVRNGQMVLEAYFYPYSKDLKHVLHSCTKSVMSALIGIALEKGYIKEIDQKIIDFFPDSDFANMDDRKKSMTLRHLLMMASGLKCRDSYRYRWLGLIEMRNSSDWAQYVLDLPMEYPPGTRFEYCNGTSYLLSVIIQNTTGMRTAAFAQKFLFKPLDITDIEWATSPQGVDIGYGELWLKPSDMAKLGLLYLNNGRWNDRQIVPGAWVAESTRGQIDADPVDQYGYQWWVDASGYYAAAGHNGQFIFVVPDKNMVVVFTSELHGYNFFIPQRMLEDYILPAAASADPLPRDKAARERLNELISSIARVETYTWTGQPDGTAKEGLYLRRPSPGFSFQYPLGSKKAKIDAPGKVMRMRTPGNVYFSASVVDIPEGLKLEDFGPVGYASQLRQVGSDVKVILNRQITLKCGSKAYQTKIEWLWNHYLPITTSLVSAYKEGRCVFVCVHPWKNHDRVEPIVTSLSLR